MDILKRQSIVQRLNGALKAVILIGGPQVSMKYNVIIGASLIESHTYGTAVQNPPDIYIYNIYIYIYIYICTYARYNYEHHFNITCTEFHTS